MPRYHFFLRDGSAGISDVDGCDCDDDAAALAHAEIVAQELMRNCEANTRHWRIGITAENGRCVAEVRFAAADQTLDHLSPDARQLVEGLSEKRLDLQEAQYKACLTIRQVRVLVARLRGRPHLISDRFGRILAP
jgi:hypothetical protein